MESFVCLPVPTIFPEPVQSGYMIGYTHAQGQAFSMLDIDLATLKNVS